MKKKLLSFLVIMLLTMCLFQVTAKTTETVSSYNGYLRIYIVEPHSRWNDKSGEPYHMGFLDFAFNEQISIDYKQTYEDTIIWDPQQEGWEIQHDNIIVIASLFNPDSHQRYSFPNPLDGGPPTNPFDAYFVDASAGAYPGETGYNTVNDDFTHTIFCEEGTATYCTPCVEAKNALDTIYNSGDYPFFYVALVDDVDNSDASTRLKNDYNVKGFPTTYFDGGYTLDVGAGNPTVTENSYRQSIESCGRKDVHKLDVELSPNWLKEDLLEIQIHITNNETNDIKIDIGKGIFGVIATIKNNGDKDLSNVKYSMYVTGRLLFIGKEVEETIPILNSMDETTIKTGLLFGLGKIKVGVSVTTDTETKTEEITDLGFLFGPFLL